jgi:hypothetical protein
MRSASNAALGLMIAIIVALTGVEGLHRGANRLQSSLCSMDGAMCNFARPSSRGRS